MSVPQGACAPPRDRSGEPFDVTGVAFDITLPAPGDARRRDQRRFELALARLSQTVDEAARRSGGRWLDRLRAGLVAFLGFLDDEPRCGALLLFKSRLQDELLALRREQRVLGVLTGMLDDGAPQAAGELSCGSPLTPELVVGGVLAVVRERLRAEDGVRLVELSPSLMAFIVVGYLGQAAASAELAGTAMLLTEKPCPPRVQPEPDMPAQSERVLADPPERSRVELPIRVTHRTLAVLHAVSRAPRASNREIARAAGLSDEGQTSRLLSRLQAHGLIENLGAGALRGEANAWVLTARGRQTLRLAGAAQNVDRASQGARRVRRPA